MIKYIVTGDVSENPSTAVTALRNIVTETKKRAEVTERYMQRWDEIEHIKRDVREETRKEVTKEVTKEDAKDLIEYGRSLGDTDENIKKRLALKYNFDAETIDKLFEEVDALKVNV